MELDDLPDDGRALVDEALAAAPEDALAIWRRIAERFAAFLPGRLNYASARLQVEGPDAARAECDALQREVGERVEIVGQRALVELADERPDTALSLADQAIAGGYEWPPLYEVRADALLLLGRIDEAEPALLEAYRREPHAWRCLQRYCELTDRPYVPPDGAPPNPPDALERLWLYAFIDRAAHTPDERGQLPGCNHTLRFVDAWCDRIHQDPIPLYQDLNARGGFCDCEVIFNVETKDARYDRLAIAGTLRGDVDTIREMLDTGVLRATAAPPEAPDEDDDQSPIAVEDRGDGVLAIWPQLAGGRAVGMLLDMSTVYAGQGASATLVVVAPDDEGSQRVWVHDAEGYAIRNLDEGEEVAPSLQAEVAAAMAALADLDRPADSPGSPN